jgi:hypothetical protein
MNRQKKPTKLFLKVDYEKVYNQIEWEFILRTPDSSFFFTKYSEIFSIVIRCSFADDSTQNTKMYSEFIEGTIHCADSCYR